MTDQPTIVEMEYPGSPAAGVNPGNPLAPGADVVGLSGGGGGRGYHLLDGLLDRVLHRYRLRPFLWLRICKWLIVSTAMLKGVELVLFAVSDSKCGVEDPTLTPAMTDYLLTFCTMQQKEFKTNRLFFLDSALILLATAIYLVLIGLISGRLNLLQRLLEEHPIEPIGAARGKLSTESLTYILGTARWRHHTRAVLLSAMFNSASILAVGCTIFFAALGKVDYTPFECDFAEAFPANWPRSTRPDKVMCLTHTASIQEAMHSLNFFLSFLASVFFLQLTASVFWFIVAVRREGVVAYDSDKFDAYEHRRTGSGGGGGNIGHYFGTGTNLFGEGRSLLDRVEDHATALRSSYAASYSTFKEGADRIRRLVPRASQEGPLSAAMPPTPRPQHRYNYDPEDADQPSPSPDGSMRPPLEATLAPLVSALPVAPTLQAVAATVAHVATTATTHTRVPGSPRLD